MRVAILYDSRKYACRHCHDLTFKSTRTAPGSKHFSRANKVRDRHSRCHRRALRYIGAQHTSGCRCDDRALPGNAGYCSLLGAGSGDLRVGRPSSRLGLFEAGLGIDILVVEIADALQLGLRTAGLCLCSCNLCAKRS